MCFYLKFAKFLRTPFFTEYLWRLLLYFTSVNFTESTGTFFGDLINFLFFFNELQHLKASIKKETLAEVFLCEVCGISKNTFFYKTPLGAAFVFHQ